MSVLEPEKRFTIPFAESGAKNVIPETTAEFGRASLKLGFPPETSVLISQGGAAPKGPDFNGIFYHITQYLQWIQSGGQWTYDATLDYASPSIVFYNNNFYTCLVDNGPGTIAGAQPPTRNAYWSTLGSKVTLAGGKPGQVLTKLSAADANVGWRHPVPTGFVLPFAAQTIPAGFLQCNGADLNRVVYADLFAVIGTMWGSSSSGTFKLPDYRGKFLRGFDTGIGIDIGRVFGSSQRDALQDIPGFFDVRQIPMSVVGNVVAVNGAFSKVEKNSTVTAINATVTGTGIERINFTPGNVARVADETRPINETVVWCIKY